MSKMYEDATVIGRINKTKPQKAMGLLRPTLDAVPLKLYKQSSHPFLCIWLPFRRMFDRINENNVDVVQ